MRHALRVAVLVVVILLALLAGGAAAASGKDEERHGEDDEPIPALEPVCSSGSNDDVGPVRQIRFGDKVALDDLGPIIVNDDCTMRRIENWPRMTDRERRGTQKRVSERNAARLAKCRDDYAKAGIWHDAYSDTEYKWKGPSRGRDPENERMDEP